jgi:hypothetical protein
MLPTDMRYLLIQVFLLFACSSANAQNGAPMSVDFSFLGSKDRCTGYFESPEMRLHNVPKGARSARLALSEKGTDMGGQDVVLPSNGLLPTGTVRTFGPCNPGVYTYSVTVKSESGQILARAEQSRTVPNDEIVK